MKFRVTVIALFFMMSLAAAASGQATRPADGTPVPTVSKSFEEETIKISSPSTVTGKPEIPGMPSISGSSDLQRVGLALAIVIGVIFLLRALGRKFFLLPTGSRSNSAIKVLTRSVLSPKQQLMLLQVGKRLVVVGDSGGQMNPLCEISEPDEVAALIGSLRSETCLASGKTFRSLFGRAKEPFESEPSERSIETAEASDVLAEPASDTAIVSTREEIVGLMDTVKRMRQQFKT